MSSSQFNVREYDGYAGSFFDSISHHALYRDGSSVHKFGMMVGKLFSSTNMMGLTDKKWTYLTYAKGNYLETKGGKDDYSWIVSGDSCIDVTILEVLEPDTVTKLGKAGNTFSVVVDRDWMKEPELWRTESDNAPMVEVIGHSRPYGMYGWKVDLRLQTGNKAEFISRKWFEKGSTLTRASSTVSDEENTKYGTAVYLNRPDNELRGVVGMFANEVKFTDKFLRIEAACMRDGGSHNESYTVRDKSGKGSSYRGSGGKTFTLNMKRKGGSKPVEKGFFVSNAEAAVYERTYMDMEEAMEFGRLQISEDRDSNRVRKMNHGWRVKVRDGQYLPHGGDLTLDQIFEFLHAIVIRKRGFKNRKPMIVTGTGGIMYLSQLMNSVVSDAVISQSQLAISKNPNPTGVHQNELQFGYQITVMQLSQGIVLQAFYDPSKDDVHRYKELAPNSTLPRESFNMDILDFGDTEDSMEIRPTSNITMIKQANADYYFSIYNAINKYGKQVIDGSNIFRHGKDYSIHAEMSGALEIFDVSSVGRIEWLTH